MQLALNIDTKEVQRASNVNEGLSKLTSGIGIVLSILLLPALFVLLAIGYIISIKANKDLKKALILLKEKAGKHDVADREDLKALFYFTENWINKHKDDIDSIKDEEYKLFRGFKREYLQMYSLVEEIHLHLQKSLYVDGSSHSFSAEEISEYLDFFGSDEDYEEDTFLQLNPNALI